MQQQEVSDPKTLTVSVPCDGVEECDEGFDEASCAKQNLSYYLLAGSILLIVLIYVGLKFHRKYCKISKKPNRTFFSDTQTVDEMMKSFLNKRNKSQILLEMNTWLFNILHSKKTEDSKVFFKQFYDLEAKIHGNDEAKIFLSLHQNLDPALVGPIVDSRFPGCKQRLINCLESLFCSRWITRLQDKIIVTEWLSELLATIFTIARVVASFAVKTLS